MYRKIRKAAVIGSGVMGGGIAALLAGAGVDTRLLDIVPFDLSDAEKDDPIARNRITKAGLDAVLNSSPPLLMQKSDVDRIQIGNLEDDLDSLKECDWIIEVVVENLKIKQDLLKRIEPIRKADAIVSTNTSGIPLKAMTNDLGMDFKKHFLGTHFFNPVRYMKLLEIIPGKETMPEVLNFMADYGERVLGKGIVWAKDTPNFVGNRIGVHGIVKAMQLMLADGLSIQEVDAIFGPVMGRPKTAMFKTSDLVGLDVLSHVAQNTFELVTDDEARDDFILPEFVTTMIDQNLLGKKTQAGFYKTELTPDWQKVRKVIDPQTLEYSEYVPPEFACLDKAKKSKTLPDKIKAVVYGNDRGARFAWKAVAHNLIYAGNRIPEISDTLVDIDNAMKWGFNLELGPFETWDAIGLTESVQKMKQDGLSVPSHITRMLEAGHKTFYKTDKEKTYYYSFADAAYKELIISDRIISLPRQKAAAKTVKTCPSVSLIDLDDGVYCLEFHTKMNALNAEILDFYNDAIDYVDTNGLGLVIGNQAGGMPGAFSAGADLKGMLSAAKDKKYAEIEAMVKHMQLTLQKAKYASFPVVTAPFGLTLGGGCEVCLASDRIVAHADLYMGLVEIGVGLLPAGGGCLNLWKKFIQSIPAAVTEADLAKFFIPVFMNIAMAKVSSSAADARANGFLGPVDKIAFNRDYLIANAKKEVLNLIEEGYAAPVMRPLTVLGETAQGMINAEIYNMLNGKFITEHDALLARRIAFVISGGDVRANSKVDETLILTLERNAFMDFLKEEKTLARIEHLLNTGKPLRN